MGAVSKRGPPRSPGPREVRRVRIPHGPGLLIPVFTPPAGCLPSLSLPPCSHIRVLVCGEFISESFFTRPRLSTALFAAVRPLSQC